jgi:hypothetical protein
MEMFGVIHYEEPLPDSFSVSFPTDLKIKSEHDTESFANSSLNSVSSDEESPPLLKYYIMCGKVGATNPYTQTRIINFHKNFNYYQKGFTRNFIQIAANPVGRILLYRLLIEIIKNDHIETIVVDRAEEDDILTVDWEKNKKNVTVIFKKNKIAYSYENSELILDLCNNEERESFCVKKMGTRI